MWHADLNTNNQMRSRNKGPFLPPTYATCPLWPVMRRYRGAAISKYQWIGTLDSSHVAQISLGRKWAQTRKKMNKIFWHMLASVWLETRCLKKLHGITFLHRCLQAQALRRPWRFQPCESWNESARVSKDSLGIYQVGDIQLTWTNIQSTFVQTRSGTKKDGTFNNFCVILLIVSMLAWKTHQSIIFKYTCNQRFFPAFPLVNSWKISWTSSDAAYTWPRIFLGCMRVMQIEIAFFLCASCHKWNKIHMPVLGNTEWIHTAKPMGI